MKNISLNNKNPEYETFMVNLHNNYIDLLEEINKLKNKIIQLELDNRKLHEKLNEITGD